MPAAWGRAICPAALQKTQLPGDAAQGPPDGNSRNSSPEEKRKFLKKYKKGARPVRAPFLYPDTQEFFGKK